jgi:hypothetical protein
MFHHIPCMTAEEAAKQTIHLNCLWEEYESWAATCDIPPTLVNFIDWNFDRDS